MRLFMPLCMYCLLSIPFRESSSQCCYPMIASNPRTVVAWRHLEFAQCCIISSATLVVLVTSTEPKARARPVSLAAIARTLSDTKLLTESTDPISGPLAPDSDTRTTQPPGGLQTIVNTAMFGVISGFY